MNKSFCQSAGSAVCLWQPGTEASDSNCTLHCCRRDGIAVRVRPHLPLVVHLSVAAAARHVPHLPALAAAGGGGGAARAGRQPRAARARRAPRARAPHARAAYRHVSQPVP